MVMPAMVPRYTNADLAAFPEDGHRYELVGGVLLVTPGPAPLHEVVVDEVSVRLREHVGHRARVMQRGTVEVDPDHHLEPDILVVPRGALPPAMDQDTRWTEIRQWWLAIEVSGLGSRIYDRDHKTPAYLALGGPEVLRIDLHDRTVEVSRPGQAIQTHHERVVWQPPVEGMKALVIEVGAMFP